MRKPLHALIVILISADLLAADYTVSGKVTDMSGRSIAGVKISMTTGSIEYAAQTDLSGNYSIRISGVYGNIHGLLEGGKPYPNPFSYSVFIPFMVSEPGVVTMSVYTLSGKKIKSYSTPYLSAGSYRISWDGRSDNGAPAGQGFYVYTLSFRGNTFSGRLIRSSLLSGYTSVTQVESVMIPSPPATASSGPLPVPVVTNVTIPGYYPLRFTDITVRRDTVIDFTITGVNDVPYKTIGSYISYYDEGYRSLLLKGINLGSSPPGTFPGEIAYAISPELYDRWIKRIARAGFNSIRIYTLHPPVFYEMLANYNNRHPENPLFLFQGIWLEEIENPLSGAEYDLTRRTVTFTNEIHEVIECIHGKKDIPFRPGKAFGSYKTDISRWTAAYIIGREISPHEVDSTNAFHPSMNSYSGSQYSISGATATETFITSMLDEAASFESDRFATVRPVSISSWPTLDPLFHPSESDPDEDMASFDISKITCEKDNGGFFATYHAYPYYPGFVSSEPSYRTFSDENGQNSYLGYLSSLKNHYSSIPLVIGEFGVPSSWGSAYQSFSNMNHGGYSEKQQGEKNIRLLRNIISSGCAGGFMFSWMDEWFKPTWIVSLLEAYGFSSGNSIVPTRQLWHNITSPEQNFGLLAFEQDNNLPVISFNIDSPSSFVNDLGVTHDNGYLFLEIKLNESVVAGDTLMIAFDTYSSSLGESRLPNGKLLKNRSEFLLELVPGADTAGFYVTQAYDMNGLTVRFDVSDPGIQKYRSIVSDGASWNLMKWTNNAFSLDYDIPGKLPVENSSRFTAGERTSVSWNSNMVKVRIPWTFLYFYDPTQMKVIDGITSSDKGLSYEIITAESDGIAVSLYMKGSVVSSTNRYYWDKWLVVPEVSPREKESLHVVEAGLESVPGFPD